MWVILQTSYYNLVCLRSRSWSELHNSWNAMLAGSKRICLLTVPCVVGTIFSQVALEHSTSQMIRSQRKTSLIRSCGNGQCAVNDVGWGPDRIVRSSIAAGADLCAFHVPGHTRTPSTAQHTSWGRRAARNGRHCLAHAMTSVEINAKRMLDEIITYVIAEIVASMSHQRRPPKLKSEERGRVEVTISHPARRILQTRWMSCASACDELRIWSFSYTSLCEIAPGS